MVVMRNSIGKSERRERETERERERERERDRQTDRQTEFLFCEARHRSEEEWEKKKLKERKSL